MAAVGAAQVGFAHVAQMLRNAAHPINMGFSNINFAKLDSVLGEQLNEITREFAALRDRLKGQPYPYQKASFTKCVFTTEALAILFDAEHVGWLLEFEHIEFYECQPQAELVQAISNMHMMFPLPRIIEVGACDLHIAEVLPLLRSIAATGKPVQLLLPSNRLGGSSRQDKGRGAPDSRDGKRATKAFADVILSGHIHNLNLWGNDFTLKQIEYLMKAATAKSSHCGVLIMDQQLGNSDDASSFIDPAALFHGAKRDEFEKTRNLADKKLHVRPGEEELDQDKEGAMGEDNGDDGFLS